MTEEQVTGYATIGGFLVAAILAFAWARVRYWKRAYLEEVQKNVDLLDRRKGGEA